MRTRTSRLVRSIGSATAALALVLAGSASPASAAGTIGDDPIFQAMSAAMSKTASALTSTCKVDFLVSIHAVQGTDLVQNDDWVQTDGVSSHEKLSSWEGTDGGDTYPVNDPDTGMLTGESFYEGGTYVSNLNGGAYKGISVAALLDRYFGNSNAFYRSAAAPDGLGTLVPSEVCISLKSQWIKLSGVIESLASVPSNTVIVHSYPNPLNLANTYAEISRTADGTTATFRVEIDAQGTATYMATEVQATGLSLWTVIMFNALGDSVVVPALPTKSIVSISEMNIAAVRFYLDPKVRAYAVDVQRGVERAAKFAKGKAKNKVTAVMIQAKTKAVVTKKTGMTYKKITGGVKIYGAKSGVTSAFCVTASGSKAKIDFC